ncbi:MAG TPA: divergent polysaccharide deacetylase family protein [Sediminispirochaeta sp.]|nr:divergent polysaccharide deacetylase family protein [Sediminispirochaeta sp.]
MNEKQSNKQSKRQDSKKTKKKRKRLSQKERVRWAFLYLTAIVVLLLLALAILPRDQEAPQEIGKEEPPRTVIPRETSEPEAAEEPKDPDRRFDQGEAAEEAPSAKKTLYLVIDDVGYNTGQLDYFLEIPIPMTFAVLPQLDHSLSAQSKILESRQELILHQPMEPVGDEDPGPGAIYVSMEPEEVSKLVTSNLGSLSEAVGLNNHMGSRATADEVLVEALYRSLEQFDRRMFFLDSRTSSESVVDRVGRRMGRPFAIRDVFLDNSSRPEDIAAALDEGLRIAEERGYAILIGHVWSQALAAVLSQRYQEVQGRGFEFDYLSNLFRLEEDNAGLGS